MRIVLVSDAWTPQVNGVVRTLTTLIAALERQGHRVLTITPDCFGRTMPCPRYPDIRLVPWSGRRLGRMIEDFAPQAIHIATEGPLGWAARRWCLRRNVPFTTAFHTRFPEYLQAHAHIPPSWTYAVLKHFHSPARRVMVATQGMDDELRAHGITNLCRWTRGVDADLFRPRNDVLFPDLPHPIFLYVGRVSAEKNLDAFLSLDLPGTKLVVGDGPQRAALQAAYPDTMFVGAQHGEHLAEYYAAADVFVFPSLTDTFGLVLLEALASGVPVAAFPVEGPRDVLAGALTGPQRVGVLAADCTPAALRAAALEALTIPPEACRAFAETRSWDTSVAQFLGNMAPFDPTLLNGVVPFQCVFPLG